MWGNMIEQQNDAEWFNADFGQMPEMHRNAENPILLSFLIMYFFKDRYWWYIFVVVLVMPSCNMKHGTEEFCLQKQDSCWGPAFTYQSTFRVNSKMNPGSIFNQRQFYFLMGIFQIFRLCCIGHPPINAGFSIASRALRCPPVTFSQDSTRSSLSWRALGVSWELSDKGWEPLWGIAMDSNWEILSFLN